MKVLVTYGSKRGGTQGLAQMVGDQLKEEGFDVDVLRPRDVRHVDAYDVVIVGGALYAFRWHRDARRFVTRHAEVLRAIPTYLFSSGPLDDSASNTDIPPVKGVTALIQSIDAKGHATFGGRLLADAKGFPASAMAKKKAGDWRNPEQVAKWVASIATDVRKD